MTAEYFYEQMLKYTEVHRSTGKVCGLYQDGCVKVHHDKDAINYFVIHEDKSVDKMQLGTGKSEPCSLSDLSGDDFQLFSLAQTIKCGYIVMPNVSTYSGVMSSISRLAEYIDYMADAEKEAGRGDTCPTLCGSVFFDYTGQTDDFQYSTGNYIEAHIRTISKLCKVNVHRTHYDAKPLPFIRGIPNDNSFYVTFTIYGDVPDKCMYKQAESALRELQSMLSNIDIQHKWVECKMKGPVYV